MQKVGKVGSALPLSVSNDHDRFEMTNGSYRSSKFLDVDALGNAQRVFELDPQISDTLLLFRTQTSL
jgi:hypothetical protein